MDLEMTRRGFISRLGGFGLAGIIAAGRAPAAIVRSALGSRGIANCEEGGDWQNPYVTEGLIAQWDGEWNAGGGVHATAAKTWKNLVVGSSYNNITVGKPESNYWDMDNVPHVQFGTFVTPLTVEVVVRGWANTNIATFRLLNYGSTWGDTSGSGALLYCRNYNNYVGCYYNGNRTGMDVPKGKPPRYVVRWDSDNKYTQIIGETVKRNLSITGLTTSVTYDSFNVNMSHGYASSNDNSRYHAIRLYSRSLTDDEVAYNYSIDQERFGI